MAKSAPSKLKKSKKCKNAKKGKTTPKKKDRKKALTILQYHEPTECDTCGYQSNVRRPGVTCASHPDPLSQPYDSSLQCQGTLVKIDP